MKTWISNSVPLPWVEDRFSASNGNKQFSVLIRCKSKKRVAEILNVSPYMLRTFYGCNAASKTLADIVKHEEVIYYRVEHTKIGYVNKWVADYRAFPRP